MKKPPFNQQKFTLVLLLITAITTFTACITTPEGGLKDRVEIGGQTDSANQNTKVSLEVSGNATPTGEAAQRGDAARSGEAIDTSITAGDESATAVDSTQLRAEKEDLLAKDRVLVDEIAATGDMARCKEISDNNLQQSCEANIIIDLATAAKDPTLCEQASFENIVADCKELVGMAIGN